MTMRSPPRRRLLLLLLRLLLVVHCLTFHSNSGEVCADDPGFDYSDGPLGPGNWGNLQKDWWACGNGTQQSPININTSSLVLDGTPHRLSFHYTIGVANIIYHEHALEIVWQEGGGGGVSWNNVEYALFNVHFHTPSEHTIDDSRFALETHIVHQAPSSNALLVVSILHNCCQTNAEIADLIGNFTGSESYANVSLDSWNLGGSYYHYPGSLTTPPCAEGVQWIILEEKRTISMEQVDEIKEANMGENARPLQALNGRTVYEKKSYEQLIVVQSHYNPWST